MNFRDSCPVVIRIKLTAPLLCPGSNAHIFCIISCSPLSRVRLFATPWTVAQQTPLSIGFSRQGYWSWLPFPSPGDLPDPGIKPGSPALQADSVLSESPGKPDFKLSPN